MTDHLSYLTSLYKFIYFSISYYLYLSILYIREVYIKRDNWYCDLCILDSRTD